LVCLMYASQFAYSQAGYESLFSNAGNKWNTAFFGIDHSYTDTVYISNDTTINSVNWKKIKASYTPGRSIIYSGGLVREDTSTGKVWYQGLNDTAKLLFDFALLKGDTFNINSAWKTYSVIEKTVDTTYILNGRKHIVFKGTVYSGFGFPNEPVTFIEGVGGNTGLLYKSPHAGMYIHYLLCAFKNGLQTYANQSLGGMCYLQTTAASQLLRSSGIKIYPTAFTNRLTIENNSNYKLTRIVLINVSGQLVYSAPCQNNPRFSDLPSGIYYLKLFAGRQEIFTKTLVRK
jgi:hypothetical protein